MLGESDNFSPHQSSTALAGYSDSGLVKKKAIASKDRAGKPSALVDTRVIYCGDNLEQLRKLPDHCIDLVYIDPPFNSNRDYEVFWGETREKRSFDDRHASTQAYIEFMRPRCIELHRVLKDTGSFYFHCDWHADSYVRVMLDQVFGENSFATHIIWRRTNAKGLASRSFPNNHDSIFYYHKSSEFTFNPLYLPHSDKLIASHYSSIEPETGRRYTLGDLLNPNPNRPNLTYEFMGMTKVWRWTRERMEQAFKDGRVIQPKPGSVPRYKRYLDEQPGVPIDSVWTDIPPVNSQAKEALGYPTQKPLPLLERIIRASTNKNDLVLDAFCGCGTALEAAENLGRQWIGIDISPTACQVMAKRLRDKCGLKENDAMRQIGRGYVLRDLPWSEDKLRKIPPFEFENWAVIRLNGQPNKTQVGDMGIDGRIFPVSALPAKTAEATGHLDFMDNWYPIQVKQKDKTGRPDIDGFEAVMVRTNKAKGFFVSFDFTTDALQEIRRFQQQTGKVIKPLKVSDMLDDHQLAYQLA